MFMSNFHYSVLYNLCFLYKATKAAWGRVDQGNIYM